MLPIFVFIGLLLTSPLPSLAARSSSVTPIPKRADSSIIDLTDANFASLLPPTNSENEYLIEFYANWCGYCRSFAPEYDNLADKVKSELPHVKLARVDIDSSPIVTARFFVSRLPSLYHVKGTQVRSVTIPGRTVSELFEFLAEEKWKDLAVWSEWTGPFSLLSQVVGLGKFLAEAPIINVRSAHACPFWGSFSKNTFGYMFQSWRFRVRAKQVS
ncbi:thioredoxin-like protein [Cladochytrium replicatum]|nr:thioredoxin-like protein [Cladochytrium replicatum]